jgi:hypothetical protein
VNEKDNTGKNRCFSVRISVIVMSYNLQNGVFLRKAHHRRTKPQSGKSRRITQSSAIFAPLRPECSDVKRSFADYVKAYMNIFIRMFVSVSYLVIFSFTNETGANCNQI